MQLKQAIEELEKSEEFLEWKKIYPHYYLAHGFMIKEESPEWQIGYTDGEKVVTFFLNPVKIMPEQETYKRPDEKIQKLEKEKLFLSLEKAEEIFNKIKNEKYASEKIFKTIILVQNNNQNMYNITGLTYSYKSLNVKIDMYGKVISDSLFSLVES